MTIPPSFAPHRRDRSTSFRSHALRGALLLLALVLGFGRADLGAIPAAPPGVVETGAPSFVVLGPEAIGLSSAPLDLHLLPDGRVLLASQNELAFGDGVRWEVFQKEPDNAGELGQLAVDDDGRIYTGIEGGFARVELNQNSRWQLTQVEKLPPEVSLQIANMNRVSEFSGRWFWFGQDEAVVSWRPGQRPRVAGKSGDVDRIFTLGGDVYLSSQVSGELLRANAAGSLERVLQTTSLVSESICCAIPWGPDRVLVGTGSAGLKIFDGKSLSPFGPRGLLKSGHRITDLCATGQQLFAAALDTVGIVFFDGEGRTVQVLDRSLDHRLARVERLQYAPNGVLWALLNDGVARVEFPSPVSNYDPLIPSSLAYALPVRHAGELWILADGRAMHGVYSATGHLQRFEDETPSGSYLFTMADFDGQLFAANDAGIYLRESTGWRLILPGILNARVLGSAGVPDEWCYVARGEYGVIHRSGQNFTTRKTSLPDLGDSYNATTDARGIAWIELGVSRICRLDPHQGNPTLEIFGTAAGLLAGWVEIYQFEGRARFHVAGRLYRFDDVQRRFVEDHELQARYPQLANSGGRPVTDPLGRLWYTLDGVPQAIDLTAGGNRPIKIPRIGFSPTGYTVEDDGVIWMFERRRLARLDLRQPSAPEIPPHVLITSVQLSPGNRHLFNPGASLAPLSYADNSLTIRFAAPANPFVAPVRFEVLLEGAGTSWFSTGGVGSATFNRLKEGDYVFRVRPLVAGSPPGAEARLAFTIRPPWFRTPLAWTTYVVTIVGLLVFITRFSAYLQRREKERLEHLVAARTGELNATNTRLSLQMQETTEKSNALSVSEERYRSLNADLEARVQERTTNLAHERDLLRGLLDSSPDQIYFKDRESHFIKCSAAQSARFGLASPEEIVGKSDFDFFSEEHARPAFDDEQEIIRTGRPLVGKIEKEIWRDGHATWVATSKMPLRNSAGEIVGTVGVSKDITELKEAEAKLEKLHQQLMETSRHAGMAEVATGVLHNVGNVLNSVNVSVTLVSEQLRRSKAVNIGKIAALFAEHKADLAAFLTTDSRGKLIPGYFDTLAESIAAEHKTVLEELEHLRKNVEHIKDIVAMQQSYAKTSGVLDTMSVPDMIEDALRINSGSLARHDVAVRRDYQVRPVVTTDKHKVMQILINLVRNAKYACDESGRTDKLITVRTTADDQFVQIAIIDNGVGIPPENLTRIFNHGFTTRKTGHGFGLHSGALAAREIGGSLQVHSDGHGRGATFILELPFKSDSPAP